MSEQYDKVLEEKRHVSSRVSDLCRYIGFGLAAVVFLLLSSNSGYAKSVALQHQNMLLLIGGTGCLTVIFDYLQFLAGYFTVNRAINNTENNYEYDRKWPAYKLRIWSFYIKQCTTIIGAATLLYLIVISTKGT
jgi:hypothetical protein